MRVKLCLLFTRQTEEFMPLDEGEASTAPKSMTIDEALTLSQSDTPDQLSQEVIVIITDTESDDDQEEENEEEDEEQVERQRSNWHCHIFVLSFTH